MSNLLSQASLVMIPSGYKEDVVYSQIPTNGNGDLSFTRASNGTRINSAGLVEVCPWNLLEQSEIFTQSIWSKNATAINTAIGASGIEGNVADAPNGTLTADRVNFNLQSDLDLGLQQIYSLAITGQSFVSSIYVKGEGSNIGKQIKLRIKRSTGGTFVSVDTTITLTADWVRITSSALTLLANNTGIQYIISSNDATNALIWGAQLNIGSTAKPYFPTTDRLNVPRLTYQNGGGGCPSLLLEKQSTNVLLRSEEFDSASWVKNGATITANTVTSPDGTQNADTLTGASGNYRIYQIVSGLSSVDYTFSVFAKKGTANLIWFDFINVGDGPSFNFTTKAWSSASGWTTSYEEHANGWFRLIATKASNTTSAGLGIKVGAVNETVYLWGAQMEASSYKTSYIQTTSSSATRVADACFKTGISSLIGQTEGTIYCDFINVPNLSFSDVLSIGAVATGLVELQTSGGSTINAVYYNGGALANIPALSTMTIGQRYKAAFAYKTNDFVFYLNGVVQGTDTSGTVTSGMAEISLNGFGSSTSNNENATINQAALFKTRLTNAELASLTTI